MLTRAMPAVTQAMRGEISPLATRRLIQAIGNCNMPLEHRGPITLAPATQVPSTAPGAYGGGGGGGPWSPEQLQSLLQQNNHGLLELFNSPSFFNNNNYLDVATSTNNRSGDVFQNTFRSGDISNTFDNSSFAGDFFDNRNLVDFITKTYPTEIILGTIGRDGFNGFDGAPGAVGAPGFSGTDGAPGAAGPAGASGRNGFSGRDGEPGPPGAAGIDGISIAGPPGARGRSGRDADIGNLRIVPGTQRYIGEPQFITKVDVTVAEGSKISIPKYKFDTDECALVSDGTEEVEVTISLTVEPELKSPGVIIPGFQVVRR